MRVSVIPPNGRPESLALHELGGFLQRRRLPASSPVVPEGSMEALPAELLLDPPPGYEAVPQTPALIAQMYVIEDEGRLCGPYREQTIRAMAGRGYFTLQARAGPTYTSERWPLYKLLSLGADFRLSRERLVLNRRHAVAARMMGVSLLVFSIPTWLAGFAGSGEAAAIAVLINLVSIFIASRATPL